MNDLRYLLIRTLFLLFALISGAVAPVFAQSAPGNLDALETRLTFIEEQIEKVKERDEQLVALRQELDKLSRSAIEFGVSFRPELSNINARLAELGAAPKEGEPAEPEIVTRERSDLLARKVTINGQLGAAETMSVRISESVNRIGDLRREIFANTLLRRTDSTGVFNLQTWNDFSADISKSLRAVQSRFNFVWNFRKGSLFAAGGLSLLLAVLAWLAFKRTFAPLLFTAEEGSLSYFRRVSLAFWSTLIPSMAVAAGLSITYGLMAYFGIFAGQSLELIQALFASVAAFYFIQRLANAVFAPRRPNCRLGDFRNSAAWALASLTTAMAAVHIADFFLSWLAEIHSTPLAVTVAESMIASILIGFLLVLIALVKPFADKETGSPRPWPAIVRVPMILLAAFVIIAAVSGYIGLARFSAAQIVVTGAILVTMLIGIQSARALSQDGALEGSSLGRHLSERYEVSESALFQLGLLLRFSIYLLVILAGLPLVALQWGFKWPDVSSMMYKMFTSVQIGSINISLFAILFGIVLFVGGFVATRQLQRWLDRNVLVKSRVDSGVRNSIRTITGYIGIGLAALIGISAAGFDLSNLALVAGALSLGIGFGLQNIVNNFVSGLILLAERPFKVGDWIVAGTTTGMVKKISVRATEIETFQKQTIILPNSELINNAVGNWTHRNHLGRVDIQVGVAYGSNPREVYDLLLNLAAEDPSVLKVPAPSAVFLGFGDSALNFELRVHIQDVLDSLVVGTRLRFAIFEALAERGIEIPFPQRDINLKTGEIEALLDKLDRRSAAGAPPLQVAPAAGEIVVPPGPTAAKPAKKKTGARQAGRQSATAGEA